MSTLRILVVGDRNGTLATLPDNLSPGELQKLFERQRDYTRKRRSGAYSHVIQCRDPATLVDLVSDITRRGHQTIDVLDIADHGGPGVMRLGIGTLFDYRAGTQQGADVMAKLTTLFSADGCFRLLGCRTASGGDGRRLLTQLVHAASFSLRIYGTIGRVRPVHFKEPGFLGKDNLLFSSEAAIDYEAPTEEQREENLGAVADPGGSRPRRARLAASAR